MSALFLKLVNMSLSASWLVLALLALRLALKRAPKCVNVLLWGMVGVRLVLPVSIESTLSLVPSAEPVSPAIIGGAAVRVSGAAATGAANSPAAAGPGLVEIMSYVWAAGAILLFLYSVVSWLWLQILVREAVRLRGRIYQSERIDSPFVLGIVRPRIYLPYQLGREELTHVLAHEQAHIARKDHWWKPLGFLLLMVYWFNPILWLAYVLLCRDIELACDERVIRTLNNEQKADYARTLVACSMDRRAVVACPLAFGEIGVKERVRSVMNYKKPTFWLILLVVVVCIAVAVCFLTNPKTDNSQTADEPAVEAPAEPAQTPTDTTPEETPAETPTEPAQAADDTEPSDAAETPAETAPETDPLLEQAISDAIYARYASGERQGTLWIGDETEGMVWAESHVLLAKEDRVAGDTVVETTVYLLVLQEQFSEQDGALTVESGAACPTAITFRRGSDGSYSAVEEYWEPRDGDAYVSDTRDKFPAAAAEEALMNDQTYIGDLLAQCYQNAQAALNGSGR